MLPIGSRIADRYTLESLLGAGGMGEVYVAFDLRLERRVALKVLVPQASYSEQTLADWTMRMMREARAAACFTHPNVVGIHDVGAHEGQPFLALELVKGASLRSYIGRDVPLGRKVAWLVDVALGLGAAHKAGVVHRDVKPDNVLVSDDGPAKVLDFGIARRVEGHQTIDPSAPTEAGMVSAMTAPGTLLGTPSYMAPEQLHGEQVDGRTDQFAWGVLAFELLSGKLPWTATDTIGTIAAILTRAPQPLPEDIPGVLREVVLRTLSRNKDDRFPTMERVAEVLRRFADRTEDEADETQESPSAQARAMADGLPASDAQTPARSGSSAEGLTTEGGLPAEIAPPKPEGTPPPFATTLQSPTQPRRLPRPSRRVTIASVAGLSLAALVAGGAYLRHRALAPRQSACAELGERYAAPVCLVPVSPEIAAKRGESFRLTTTRGRIVRVESVNGRGTRMEESGDRDVYVRDYRYRADGSVEEILFTDQLGRFRRKIVVTENGARLAVVDLEGRPLGLRGTSITRIDRVLDGQGNVSTESFHTRSGGPRADAAGASGHVFAYDAQGREIRKTHLGADQKPVVSSGGVVTERCVPAPLGGCMEVRHEGADGKPAHEKGVYLTKREHDANGNVTLVATFATDERPTSPVGEAVFSTRFVYDGGGNLLEARYLGKDGTPVRVGHGFSAGFRFAYSAAGRRTEERHLDPDGNLMRSAWGASIFRYTYDETTGALIEEAGFDANDAPTVYTFGCARRKIEQLVSPRAWSVRCFDGKGEPSRDTAGVHWNRYEADPSGKVMTWSSLDAKGALTVNRELEAQVRWKYDAVGNEVERAVSGADQQPGANVQGYAKRRQTWDADGNLVEIAYLDASGAPTFHRDGYASTRMKYDARGLRTEQTWLDTHGNGIIRSGGFAGERHVYDRQGRLVSTTALDGAGAPTRRAGGYTTVKHARDGGGRIVLTSYLDEKDAPIRGEERWAVERTVYDDRGLPLSFAYEDGNEKPVLRAGGYAKKELTYDERGNPLSQRWLGIEGKPVLGPDGVAATLYRYDDADRVVSVQSVGENGEAAANEEGYAYLQSRYDEDGNEVETSTLDASRRPVAPRGKSYATVRRTFDARRNNLELATFDVRGGPVVGDSGAAVSRFVYDGLGRVVSAATFDTRGLPVVGVAGAAIVTTVFDEHGNVIERTFRDGAGKPTLGKEGYATRRALYDARGRTTEESFFDEAGKPVLTRAGVAKRRFVLDLRGNLLETVFLGLAGEPVQATDGVSTERRTYDDRSRLLEISRFDLAGKPTAGSDQCHRVTVRYEPGPGESGRDCLDVAGIKVRNTAKKPLPEVTPALRTKKKQRDGYPLLRCWIAANVPRTPG